MSEWLNTSSDLQSFCDEAQQAGAVALDTEFLREKTYYPELCLIQAAVPGRLVLIDALAKLDWAPLRQLLLAEVPKILHACRQDQEVLIVAMKASPVPLFDTQLAAALCGFSAQASYASLVSDLCGVELHKGATRTDWSRRPLSAEQLSYAADDVRHLHAIQESLVTRLDELGRRGWFDEDMAQLAVAPQDPDPLTVWQRIKGAGALSGQERAILRQLAAWRERRAVEKNRPRRWILADDVLLQLAQRQPATTDQLSALGVHDKLVQYQGAQIVQALERGQADPSLEPELRIPDKTTVKRLQQALKAHAQELQMDSVMLATRSDLNQLALDGEAPRLARGWRADVVLPQLTAAL